MNTKQVLVVRKDLNMRRGKESAQCSHASQAFMVNNYLHGGKPTDDAVEWEKITNCIEAAKSAPSAGNLQNWKFVIVKDPNKRQMIAEACLQQYWMSQAQVHIVVFALPDRAVRFYGVRGERMYTIQNCAAACQNMLLMAHEQGLGACWVSAFDENQLMRVLGAADFARPQAVITLGYPAEKPVEPIHFTIEHVCFFEKWAGRIADFDATFGHYGNKVQNHIDASKGYLKTKFGKLKDSIKEKFTPKKKD